MSPCHLVIPAAVFAAGVVLGLFIVGRGAGQAGSRAKPVLSPESVLEARLRDAVGRAPGSAAAHRELGRCYLATGRRPFEGLWELEQARALEPQGRGTRIDIATALAMAGLYRAAEEELDAAIRMPPPGRDGRSQLAALYLATARPAESAALLGVTPGLTTWPEAQVLLGRACEGVGDLSGARRAYERSMQLSSPEGAFHLARLLLVTGDAPAARTVLEQMRAWSPREPRLLQVLAMTYSSRWGAPEEPSREGELLAAALKAGSADEVPARLALGQLCLRHRRFVEAGRQLARVTALTDDPPAHDGLAHALAGLGQPAEALYHRGMAALLREDADVALGIFRKLAALAPDDSRVPRLISQCYARMNDLNTAIKADRLVYHRGDRSPELMERLVTISLLTFDRRAARRYAEEWSRLHPDAARPLAHIAQVALADLRLGDAIAAYEQAVALEPGNAEYLRGLAEALGQRPSPSNDARSVELLRRAVAIAPADGRAHYLLGVRLQQRGQWEEAREALVRALDADASQPATYNNLLQVATALRQPALAQRLRALLRVVEEERRTEKDLRRRRWARPEDPRVYLALASFHARRGALGTAEPLLDRALALRPGWTEASRLRVRIRRLLDGMDADGRRLVSFDPEGAAGENRR